MNLLNWLRLSSFTLLVTPVPPEGGDVYSASAWQEYAWRMANIHWLRVQCALVWSLAIELGFGITFLIGGGTGMIYTQPVLLIAIAGAVYYTQRRLAGHDDIICDTPILDAMAVHV